MSLSHFEILSEVLISTPPVGPDHVQSLVSSNLMEVRISHIVLLSISWHSSVSYWSSVSFICLSKSVSPMSYHSFLLYINKILNIKFIKLFVLLCEQAMYNKKEE